MIYIYIFRYGHVCIGHTGILSFETREWTMYIFVLQVSISVSLKQLSQHAVHRAGAPSSQGIGPNLATNHRP